MVLDCMERNEVERNTTVCVGRLTIIVIMLLAAAWRGFQHMRLYLLTKFNFYIPERVSILK